MTGHECRPLVDADGQIIGHARMASDASPEAVAAVTALAEAVRRIAADQPSDPGREARAAAALERVRRRVVEVRGYPDGGAS